MKIDAHQHFWRLSNPFCDWPTAAEDRIYADFEPAHLEPQLAANDIAGSVLVQAAPSVAETFYLLEIAQETSFVRAVVGWIDFASPSALSDLEALARHPLLRGIRPMLQSIPDPAWMLDPAFDGIYRRLAELGLCFDALITPAHLDLLPVLAGRNPELSIVIDHAAKPAIRDGQQAYDYWAPRIARLGDFPNVSCKLSGLLTEARPGATLMDIRPYLDCLYETFGPKRLLWGSDWPVLLLEADYGRWLSICEEWLSDKSPAARDEIFGLTAGRVYGIAGTAAQGDRSRATGGRWHGAH